MKRSPILFSTLVLAFFVWSCDADVTKEGEEGDKITIEIKTDEIKEGIEEGMEGLEEGLSEMAQGLADALGNISIEVDGD